MRLIHKDGTTADGRLCLRLPGDRFPPPIAPEVHTLFEDHPVALIGEGVTVL